MPYSERLKQVLGEPEGILAGVSGGKAALRIGAAGLELSNTSVIDLKKGLYGRDGYAVRIVARAYAKDLLAQFGDEIEQVVGVRTPDAAEQWLLWVADPRLANLDSGPSLAGPLRLLEGLDAIQAEFPDFEVTVPRFSGGVRNLTVTEAEEWIGLIRAHVIRERELRDAAATSAQPKDKASAPPKAAQRGIGKTR